MKIVSLSLHLSLSLCVHKTKHNDLNYAHSSLIKEGKREEEEEDDDDGEEGGGPSLVVLVAAQKVLFK